MGFEFQDSNVDGSFWISRSAVEPSGIFSTNSLGGLLISAKELRIGVLCRADQPLYYEVNRVDQVKF